MPMRIRNGLADHAIQMIGRELVEAFDRNVGPVEREARTARLIEEIHDARKSTDEPLLAHEKTAVLLGRATTRVDRRSEEAIDLLERQREWRAAVARLLQGRPDQQRYSR